MKYGYDNKAGWEKVKNEKISLPTTVDGIIDFTYMEEYINNIGKLVAQKVVYWLEQQQINNNILEIERTLPKGALPMVAEKGFRH